MLLRRRVPEVVEADLVERRRRLVAGDVPAELRGLLVGLQHRRHRVPADQRADAPLDRLVARILRLLADRDRVDVRRRARRAAATRRRGRACATSRSSRKRARSAPSLRSTESSDSSHSRVSSASMSVVALPLASVEAMLTLPVCLPGVPSARRSILVSAPERGADVLQRSGAVRRPAAVSSSACSVPSANDDGGVDAQHGVAADRAGAEARGEDPHRPVDHAVARPRRRWRSGCSRPRCCRPARC